MGCRWVFPDPVFGPTVFSGKELDLIRTAEFTRLQDIRQLSTAYLFYPAANHSRFEHSLGVARLVRDFAINILDETPRVISLLVYAGLLHDIGHPAWSHAGELFMKYRGVDIDHAMLSSGLVEGDPQLTQYFSGYNLPLVSEVLSKDERSLVSKLVNGKAPINTTGKNQAEVEREEKDTRYLGQIINSRALDFDRLEYLTRDAFYTATSSSFFKLKDVFENLKIEKTIDATELVFGNKDFAESFVLTRELAYSGLYQNTENLISKEMLARAFDLCFDASVDPHVIWFKPDQELLAQMSSNDKSNAIIRYLRNRQIYEVMYNNNFLGLPNQAIAKLKSLAKPQILDVEKELAGSDLKPSQILICIAISREPVEKLSWVSTPNGPEPLYRISPLIHGMDTNYSDSRSRVVFAVDPRLDSTKKQNMLRMFKSYFSIP